MMGPSPRRLLVFIVLVRETTVSTTLLLLLCLLLLLLGWHSIMIHARRTTHRISIAANSMTISHVVRARYAITTQIRLGLVITSISTSRGVAVLVMVAIRAISTTSASLLVTTTSASTLAIPHVSTTPSTTTWSTTRSAAIIVMALMSGCAITTPTDTLSSHQALVSVTKLMSSLGRGKRLLPIPMTILHSISRVAHLRELTSIHVGWVWVLHGGHTWRHSCIGVAGVTRGCTCRGVIAL
mmetsp:Transcript_11004/g.19206  ORF Transcript_11004/g.19206 Transcript_11004/m.19206 type:complete len:240 (+) Transcript_11004:401-1120(+)